MSKQRGDPSCGTSSEDVLLPTELHPACRQRPSSIRPKVPAWLSNCLGRSAYLVGRAPSTMYSLLPDRKMIAPSDTSLAPDFTMWSDGSPFAASLGDFELAHIDEYALIVGELPNGIWCTPIICHAPHINVVVVPRIKLEPIQMSIRQLL